MAARCRQCRAAALVGRRTPCAITDRFGSPLLALALRVSSSSSSAWHQARVAATHVHARAHTTVISRWAKVVDFAHSERGATSLHSSGGCVLNRRPPPSSRATHTARLWHMRHEQTETALSTKQPLPRHSPKRGAASSSTPQWLPGHCPCAPRDPCLRSSKDSASRWGKVPSTATHQRAGTACVCACVYCHGSRAGKHPPISVAPVSPRASQEGRHLPGLPYCAGNCGRQSVVSWASPVPAAARLARRDGLGLLAAGHPLSHLESGAATPWSPSAADQSCCCYAFARGRP